MLSVMKLMLSVWEGWLYFVDSYSGHAVVIDPQVFNVGDYVGDLVDPNGIKMLN